MTYNHLTPTELVMIEAYFNQSQPVSKVANLLQRSRQTIYKVYRFLKSGGSAMSYYKQYRKNKRNCGRHPIVLPDEQQEYIQKKVVQGWAPDVLIGRAEFPIACSVRTLYRMFKDKTFDTHDLPMKGKRKPNGHKEKRENKGFAGQSETERQTIPSLIMNLVTWKVTLSWVENIKARSSH